MTTATRTPTTRTITPMPARHFAAYTKDGAGQPWKFYSSWVVFSDADLASVRRMARLGFDVGRREHPDFAIVLVELPNPRQRRSPAQLPKRLAARDLRNLEIEMELPNDEDQAALDAEEAAEICAARGHDWGDWEQVQRPVETAIRRPYNRTAHRATYMAWVGKRTCQRCDKSEYDQ